MTHEDPTKRLTKYLSDAIPLGEHPTPFNEWISVRLDIVQETIDHLDWLEKGNAEWRRVHSKEAQLRRLYEAQAKIAIELIENMLNCETVGERLRIDKTAREWLASIGR